MRDVASFFPSFPPILICRARRLALIAAEESPWRAPEAVLLECDDQLEQLAECVRARLRLEASHGSGNSAEVECALGQTATVLFGSAGAADDGVGAHLFRGESPNYYDPRNSFVTCALERRCGIPITLSLIFAEVCFRASGVATVGLNAPGHLLVAPAAAQYDLAVDCFAGGSMLRGGSLRSFVAHRAGLATHAEADALLKELRDQPMSPRFFPQSGSASFLGKLEVSNSCLPPEEERCSYYAARREWVARSLRNLLAIYWVSNDPVRLLGTAERLLLLVDTARERRT